MMTIFSAARFLAFAVFLLIGRLFSNSSPFLRQQFCSNAAQEVVAISLQMDFDAMIGSGCAGHKTLVRMPQISK